MLPDNDPQNEHSGKVHLSRRDVLKLGAVCAAGLVVEPLVSACTGSAAKPAATSTPSSSESGNNSANSRVITTKDGRKICYLESGKLDGIPVLASTGTPGSKLLYGGWVEDALSRGIRLISYDRPGYGDSTPYPGRTVASAADDIAAIAKELGLDRLLVWGVYGGGPPALAAAALLPDLVVAAAVLASPAPYSADGLNWFDGMNQDIAGEYQFALKGRDAMLQFLESIASLELSLDSTRLIQAYASVNSQDAKILTKDMADYLLADVHESVKERREGWADDEISFLRPWGFELSQIRIPVLLMHGEQDSDVPVSHGRWLAGKIQKVDARFLADEGHLSVIFGHMPEAHAWLLSKIQ